MTAGGFAHFAEFRWPRLVRSARLLGCSPEDAEDVAQTALLQTMRAWSKVERAGDPDAYVYRILVNCFLKSRRRTGERLAHSDISAVDFHYEDPDPAMALSLAAAMQRLSLDQRSVVVLRYYADLTEQQTAKALGLPVGTVKSRTARALTQLSKDSHLYALLEN